MDCGETDTQDDCRRWKWHWTFPQSGLQSSCETLDSTIVQPNSCPQKQTQANNTLSVIQSSHRSFYAGLWWWWWWEVFKKTNSHLLHLNRQQDKSRPDLSFVMLLFCFDNNKPLKSLFRFLTLEKKCLRFSCLYYLMPLFIFERKANNSKEEY